MSDDSSDDTKFQIFRAADAPSLVDAKCMEVRPFTDVQAAGFQAMFAAGPERGDDTTVLVNIPGFSLVHAWFKKDYPLPLHSHSADCLYFIIAGTLKLGTEWLGARDSFFVPKDVPYTYTPGPDGVEVIEFRHEQTFDFDLKAKGEAFWSRAAETVAGRQEEWKTAKRPALNA